MTPDRFQIFHYNKEKFTQIFNLGPTGKKMEGQLKKKKLHYIPSDKKDLDSDIAKYLFIACIF
jgi:hypothetical protein